MMQKVISSLIFAYLALKVAAALEKNASGSCPLCNVENCVDEEVVQKSCPDSTLVADPCGCCKVCGRKFGETCGGAYEYLGKCEYHLVCTAKSSEYFSGTNVSGICTSKYVYTNIYAAVGLNSY